MSTVIELLAHADKVAVELHPLDTVHAEAARELADLESRIEVARAKAQVALDAKADLSARFEAIVSDLAKAGVDRQTVESMVADRIAFLVKVGALSAAVATPAPKTPATPEDRTAASAIPAPGPVKAAEPAPAPVVAPPVEVPAAAVPVVEKPVVEEPVVEQLSADPAPDVVVPPMVAHAESDGEGNDAPGDAVVQEPEAIELPSLRLAGGTSAAVSPIPASRQRRPRNAPAVEPVVDANHAETPQAQVEDITVDSSAGVSPTQAEQTVAESVSPKAYLEVVGALDIDADEDEGDAGAGETSVEEEDAAEENSASTEEPPVSQARVEPAPVEPAKPAAVVPAVDEEAFIPAFLRG